MTERGIWIRGSIRNVISSYVLEGDIWGRLQGYCLAKWINLEHEG